MILKFKLLEKYLNFLLVFLLPTQLALHFWPKFAFIFGIRVDYLAPAIYLTDVLFVFLFINWLLKFYKDLRKDLIKNKFYLIIFLLVLGLNLLFSTSLPISLIKWLKIVELICFAYYVQKRKDVFNLANINKIFFTSLVFFSLIGILQFIRGSTLGNFFYILGERNFSLNTPGIALVNFLGKNRLRAYSTFPHPNALAGFLGAVLIFLFFNDIKFNKLAKYTGYFLILLTFLLTFSLSAFSALLACFVFYLIFNKRLLNAKIYFFTLLLIMLLSIYFSFFSKSILDSPISLPKSYSERLDLADVSGNLFSSKWLLGTGLNTFTINEVLFSSTGKDVWLLQPVHNIYLLIFSETGITGILLFTAIVILIIQKLVGAKEIWGLIILLFILVTDLFDHYWLTIQQNLFLFSFFAGLFIRKDK